MRIIQSAEAIAATPPPPSSDIPAETVNAVEDQSANDRTGAGVFGVARCGGSQPTTRT
jgi:hypothetical protein